MGCDDRLARDGPAFRYLKYYEQAKPLYPCGELFLPIYNEI